MKTIGIVLLGIMLNVTSSYAQTLNDKGLYVDSDGELFNGTISKTQNSVKSDFTVKDGTITGEATYYFASGKLMETGSFVNGKKDQKWTRYTENGSISAVAFYSLGKKTGTWLVFDDKNNKRFEMNYDNGEKIGVWTSWDENGMVADTKDYSQAN
jgi:antitoxin component YwqK of YwqJK toxin-antitoxin module